MLRAQCTAWVSAVQRGLFVAAAGLSRDSHAEFFPVRRAGLRRQGGHRLLFARGPGRDRVDRGTNRRAAGRPGGDRASWAVACLLRPDCCRRSRDAGPGSRAMRHQSPSGNPAAAAPCDGRGGRLRHEPALQAVGRADGCAGGHAAHHQQHPVVPGRGRRTAAPSTGQPTLLGSLAFDAVLARRWRRCRPDVLAMEPRSPLGPGISLSLGSKTAGSGRLVDESRIDRRFSGGGRVPLRPGVHRTGRAL